MKPRKMYIDVDGVLVVWDEAYSCIELARGFGRLMRFCLLHGIQPYWLSLWQPEYLEGLSRLIWGLCDTMARPTVLAVERGGKARAIDYESDFVWIEDGLHPEDEAHLRERGALDRFFATDGRDPDALLKFMEFTAQRLGLPEIRDWHADFDPPVGPGDKPI